MTQSRRYHKRVQKARQRRLQKERERLQREQVRAQRALQAVEQAIQELGLPETVADEVQWRLQAQQKLLGKIVGMMFPPCVWLPQLPRVVPGARLGPASARSYPGRVAQTAVDQAPAAAGTGGLGAPVAAGRDEKLRHPQSLAMDLGRRRQPVQEVWPAVGLGGAGVEWPGASGAPRDRWPAVAGGAWRGETRGASGL
jgi:hypothetical protein